MATQSISTTMAVQSVFNGLPNLLMFEAESELDGEDAGHRMNEAVMNLKMQEGVDMFKERFQGR